MINFELEIQRLTIETAEKWRSTCNEIPFLHFDADWNVKVIPPFGGAMARFIVEKNGKSISVYCDFFDRMGFMNKPYWEIHPYFDDIQRFDLNNTEEMLECIREELNRK